MFHGGQKANVQRVLTFSSYEYRMLAVDKNEVIEGQAVLVIEIKTFDVAGIF